MENKIIYFKNMLYKVISDDNVVLSIRNLKQDDEIAVNNNIACVSYTNILNYTHFTSEICKKKPVKKINKIDQMNNITIINNINDVYLIYYEECKKTQLLYDYSTSDFKNNKDQLRSNSFLYTTIWGICTQLQNTTERNKINVRDNLHGNLFDYFSVEDKNKLQEDIKFLNLENCYNDIIEFYSNYKKII